MKSSTARHSVAGQGVARLCIENVMKTNKKESDIDLLTETLKKLKGTKFRRQAHIILTMGFKRNGHSQDKRLEDSQIRGS
jgi:hypothetical protein